jgi:hypothetical protein
MDTDKLLKAIQILVEAEVKKQLPKIVAEVVGSTQNKRIVETKKETPATTVKKTPSIAKAILGETKVSKVNDVQYTKNPVLNQILNETRANTSYVGGIESGYEEWPTMNASIPSPSNGMDINSVRSQMASKMGYGDMNTGGGLGVKTGNEALDKALNRNYSELVKRF